MSKLPNFQDALLSISSLFGSSRWQSIIRKRFTNNEMRFAPSQERMLELLTLTRRALSLDEGSDVWEDTLLQIYAIGGNLDFLALHARTFNASPQQVLWVMMGQHLMPGLGRTWAFWCRDTAIMPDIPGGDLWFLPRPDPKEIRRLVLPVQVIARWWHDQLGVPLEQIWPDAQDDRLRTFHNWLAGRTTPDPTKLASWFSDNERFVYHDRVSLPPSPLVVRNLFLWARALEASYKLLVRSITPDVNPNETNPQINKVLQLLEVFRLAHFHTVSPEQGRFVDEDRAFVESVPDWLSVGPFFSIMPGKNGNPPTPRWAADRITDLFKHLPSGDILPDIYSDQEMQIPSVSNRCNIVSHDREQMLARIQAGFEAWQSTAPNRALKVGAVLSDLQAMPRRKEIAADILYLEALDALARNDFEKAQSSLDTGLDLCSLASFGSVSVEIANLSFALAFTRNSFDQNKCERSFRLMSRDIAPDDALKWKIGNAPFEHSIRLAAADMSDRFWVEGIRPYRGIKITKPNQKNSEKLFVTYLKLASKASTEIEVNEFCRRNGELLKRKLRNVRGDTFFTATLKFTHGIMSNPKQLLRGVEDVPKVSATRSDEVMMIKNLQHAQHLLAKALPVDTLDKRDYLKQSALMLAASANSAELVRILLERQVDLDAQDTLGRTALHSAAMAGSDECFRLILTAGADPTLKTSGGKTPAVIAAEFGRAEIFAIRLQHRTRPVTNNEMLVAREMAQTRAKKYKCWRKEYAIQGISIGGRPGYQKIAKMSATGSDS